SAAPATALDAGLAIAARGFGVTFLVVPAPVAPAAALVAAWPDRRLATWSSPASGDAAETTLVGIDVAYEVRGRGARRWREVVAGAEQLIIGSAVVQGAEVPLSTLGLGRPRFLGGGAFAPGAADRGPWVPFGDARFVLPRWLYASDGVRACLVLA